MLRYHTSSGAVIAWRQSEGESITPTGSYVPLRRFEVRSSSGGAFVFRRRRDTGSGVSVSVPAGALTITGFAPTVAAGSTASVSVPAGALTLTGFAPTVTTAANPITVSIPVGALTLTGFAPTIQIRAPQLGARLDEYPRLPADSAQLSVKLTELFSKTNLRVNELSQGFLWASWNATGVQPDSASGAWGDTVRNSRPVELGTAGSKYVIVGWIRLETDWSPMRVLTGN